MSDEKKQMPTLEQALGVNDSDIFGLKRRSMTLFAGTDPNLPQTTLLADLDDKIAVVENYLQKLGVNMQDVGVLYTIAFARRLVDLGVLTEAQLVDFRVDFAAFYLSQVRAAAKAAKEQVEQAQAQARMQTLLNGVSPIRKPKKS